MTLILHENKISWRAVLILLVAIISSSQWVAQGCPPGNPTTIIQVHPLSSSTMHIQWTTVTGATKYRIYSSTTLTGSYVCRWTTDTPVDNWDDPGLTAGTWYYYKVAYVKGEVESLQSSAIGNITCPVAPILDSVAPKSGTYNTLVVSWTGSSSASGYNVYRAESADGPYVVVKNNAATAPVDDNVPMQGHTYYYKASALNSGGESALSDPPVQNKTPLSSVVNVVAQAVSPFRVDITWNYDYQGIGGIDIERQKEGTTGWTRISGTVLKMGLNQSYVYSDPTVWASTAISNSRYRYRVTAWVDDVVQNTLVQSWSVPVEPSAGIVTMPTIPTGSTVSNIGGGIPGVKITGMAAADQFGGAASGVGDVNGDGVEEFAIGSTKLTINGHVETGETFLFNSRKLSSLIQNGTIDLATALQNPANSDKVVRISRRSTSENYVGTGASICGVGDFNGDGYSDFVIGCNPLHSGQVFTMQLYLIYGSINGIGDANGLLDLDHLEIDQNHDGRPDGVAITGPSATNCYYSWGTRAGDINGDGYDDLLINYSFAGYFFVIYGKPSLGTNGVYNLASGNIDKNDGFRISYYDDYGQVCISGAGDVNGDGYDDLITSRPYNDGGLGDSYLIFGRSANLGVACGGTINVDNVSFTTNYGMLFLGNEAGDYSGWSVSAAGDVDGDGYADLLIGAKNSDPDGGSGDRMDAGLTYLVFGSSAFKPGASPSTINLPEINSSTAQGILMFKGMTYGNWSGESVSGVGDINGDGHADLLIGTHMVSPNDIRYAGNAYLIYGRGRDPQVPTDFLLSTYDLRDLGSTTLPGIRFDGTSPNAWAGLVCGAGDINNDGIKDFLISEPYDFYNASSPKGNVYLVYGTPSPGISSRVYRRYLPAGDAPMTGIGLVGNGVDSIPSSRCWIAYDQGNFASKESVTINSGQGGLADLGQSNQIANVYWQITSDRQNWNTAMAKVRFKYLDSEVSGLDMDRISLYYRVNMTAGTWTPVPNLTIDKSTNEIMGQFLGSGFYAISTMNDTSSIKWLKSDNCTH